MNDFLRYSVLQIIRVREYDNVTGEGYWSEEYYRIHGFEPGEVTPIEASVMAQVHPDDREMLE